MRRPYRLVPKLCLGMPLQAKLSLASIFVPKYNLGMREEIAALPGFNQKIAEDLKEWLAGEGADPWVRLNTALFPS